MGRMEWNGGGEWDNCNSIINKYIFKKYICISNQFCTGDFVMMEWDNNMRQNCGLWNTPLKMQGIAIYSAKSS